jgi:Ca2+-binding RTX toxin-like protein
VNNTFDAGIVETKPPKVDIYGTDGMDSLTGTAVDENLFGKGGNDRLRGGGGNDCLFGGSGNDDLFGDAGDDILNGMDAIALGVNERDAFKGGTGFDLFIAGDADNLYYVGKGDTDKAVIEDFSISEDVVQLHGSASDYQATFTNGSTLIYQQTNASLDLVVAIRTVDTTDLNSSVYAYV